MSHTYMSAVSELLAETLGADVSCRLRTVIFSQSTIRTRCWLSVLRVALNPRDTRFMTNLAPRVVSRPFPYMPRTGSWLARSWDWPGEVRTN